MKKEFMAALLLAVLIGLSAYNLKCVNELTDQLLSYLEQAQLHSERGCFEEALEQLDSAFCHWENSYGYSHILIRHSEIDSTADCFFDLREILLEKDSAGAEAAFMKLRYHLECIAQMERPTPGSIL